MCGHTRNDKIMNKDILGKLGVIEIVGKMRKNRLRDSKKRQDQKGRGRAKKILEETLRKDLDDLDLTEYVTQNRTQ
ncbi:hypothetical protein DVH24_006815 [Malus domestica]|uniref:Uncharacterized protein n=1 Tax=Malus domestica TaxID=3750 RepID=A0A498J5V1_MALDO|nr:hypothetical protein DVH24_006815 [Malus domestica]